MTNGEKYAAFLLTAVSKKALVISGVPTEDYKEAIVMINIIRAVKRKLDAAISQLCDVSWMFTKSPGRDFSRSRKLPFREVISLLLSMEGGTLTTEMLKHFGCSAGIASTSAFVQQRGKINADAFPTLFDLFVQKTN